MTPGSTLIEANDTVRWKGATDANGTLNAFTLKAYDGDLTSTSAVQVTVQVSAVNDAPVLTGAGGTLAYTENDGAKVIDADLTINDVDDANIESATVTISSGFQSAEDVLAFTNANGITGSWNGSTGVLTLSGSATRAHYELSLIHI